MIKVYLDPAWISWVSETCELRLIQIIYLCSAITQKFNWQFERSTFRCSVLYSYPTWSAAIKTHDELLENSFKYCSVTVAQPRILFGRRQSMMSLVIDVFLTAENWFSTSKNLNKFASGGGMVTVVMNILKNHTHWMQDGLLYILKAFVIPKVKSLAALLYVNTENGNESRSSLKFLLHFPENWRLYSSLGMFCLYLIWKMQNTALSFFTVYFCSQTWTLEESKLVMIWLNLFFSKRSQIRFCNTNIDKTISRLLHSTDF